MLMCNLMQQYLNRSVPQYNNAKTHKDGTLCTIVGHVCKSVFGHVYCNVATFREALNAM